MAIFTIAKWFSDRNGLAKPKSVMEFEDSLFKLRDVTTKKQLLYPACSVRDLQIYWFVTQRGIICSATTMLKLDFDSLLILYSNHTFDLCQQEDRWTARQGPRFREISTALCSGDTGLPLNAWNDWVDFLMNISGVSSKEFFKYEISFPVSKSKHQVSAGT